MLTTVLTWLLPFLGMAVGKWLAGFFSQACPSVPTAFLCQHWDLFCTVAGGALGALGFTVTRPKPTTGTSSSPLTNGPVPLDKPVTGGVISANPDGSFTLDQKPTPPDDFGP